MKTPVIHQPIRRKAFTLIELLTVIAVIAILAALIFPITGAVNKAKIKARARGELSAIENAIANYKTQLGYYPPDNPDNFALNQLYFELLGTTLDNNGVYRTLDGSAQIRATDISTVFASPKVSGFMNVTRGAGDEGASARKFLVNLKPDQVAELQYAALTPGPRLLVCGVPWPANHPVQWVAVPPATKAGLNPWRYNSSSPTNNPNSFDLWIDVVIGSTTYRVSNWSREPLIVKIP